MPSFTPKLRLMAAVSLLVPALCVHPAFGGEDYDRTHSFQVPGCTATFPLSINEAGTITGYYTDKSGVSRGFVRYFDGDIITFKVPGSVATEPVSINAAGDIAGYYSIASSTPGASIPQGFLRTADGKFTTFGNNSLSATPPTFLAQPVAIDAAGEILGNYPSIALASIVFLRSPSGAVSIFSLSIGASYSTVATGLNAGGAVVGYASSSSLSVAQGFLWDGQGSLPNPGGGYIAVDVAGSTGTFPTGINAEGALVGCYSAGGVYHDFLRHTDGDIETLNLPGTIPSCLASFPQAGFFGVTPQSVTISDRGTIIGYYTNAAKVSRAFVRFEGGKVATFDHAGSRQTIPTSINNCDVITGYYSQGSTIVGFVREL